MFKLFFLILLALCVYIFLTVTPSSKSDVTHTVALIPHHIGMVFNAISERAMELQDYDTEQ